MATVSFKPSRQFLKRLRRQNGLSRKDAAELAQCTGGDTWGRWERGENMSARMVAYVSIAFKISLEDICPGLRRKPKALRKLQDLRAKLSQDPTLWGPDEQRKIHFQHLRAIGGEPWARELWAFEVLCDTLKPQMTKGDHVLCHAIEEPVEGDRAFVWHEGGAVCGKYSPNENGVVIHDSNNKVAKVIPPKQVELALRIDGVIFKNKHR